MHILEEWRIRDIEQKAESAVRRLYEIDSINSRLDGMERSIREVCSENSGLRDELSVQASQIRDLLETITRLEQQM